MPAARPSRLAVRLVAGLLIAGASAPSAQAAAIVPDATPLWISSPIAGGPTACPTAADANGEGAIAAVRSAPRGDARSERAFSLIIRDGFRRPPVAAICDPDAFARRTVPGPITGQVANQVRDVVFWGERGLSTERAGGGVGPDGTVDALVPGDDLTLPAAGPRSSLDLTVAAGDSSTTLRVTDGAPLPRRVQITGTTAAPSLLITEASGAQRTLAVPLPPAGAPVVTPRRIGGRLRATVRTAPGTFVAFAGDEGTVLVTRRGRSTVSIAAPRGTGKTIFLVVHDPRTRRTWARLCTTTRASLRCKPTIYGATAFTSTILDDPAPADDAQAGGPASRATSGGTARGARATTYAPATVTRVAAGTGANLDIAPSDLNNDGRPDGYTETYSGEAALFVSSNGGWTRLPLRGDFSGDSDTPLVLPDLTGDGRAELRTASGSIVTDALAGPSLPERVDLGRDRAPAPTDLEPHSRRGQWSIFEPFPTAALNDVTGDGRPELASTDTGPLVITPSESWPLGRYVPKARIAPLAWPSRPTTLEQLLGFLASDDTPGELDYAKANLDHVITMGRLFTVSPVDRLRVSRTVAKPIVLEERRADGSRVSSRQFSAAGWPLLRDVDPVTGEALVQLTGPGRCALSPKVRGIPFRERVCKDRLLRVGADGTILQNIVVERGDDTPLNAVFAGDGGDADSRPEIFVARTGGLNPGELHELASSATVPATIDELPIVDLGGRRRDDLASSLALAEAGGRRWPMVVTSPVFAEDEDPPNELLVVEPK